MEIVDSDTGIIHKKWIICYSTCLSCLTTGDSLEHKCVSCEPTRVTPSDFESDALTTRPNCLTTLIIFFWF